MAVSSGFGSAFTGFGSGYMNALRQGQSERNSLMNAKLKREEINRKSAEDRANADFRALQKASMMQNQEARNEYLTSQAATNKDKLRNQTLYNATRLLTAHMPRIQGITDPDQNEAERAAVRNAVGSILSTSGHFKPDEITGITQSWLPSVGTAVQGSMKTVNRLGDVDTSKTTNMSYTDALKQFGNVAPGRSTKITTGPDGMPMGQDIQVTQRDPSLIAMSGAQNWYGKNPASTQPNIADPTGMRGFTNWMQGPKDARGNQDFQGQATPDQRFDVTSTPRSVYQEQVPVTARTGLGDVDQAKVDFSNANTANLLQKTDLAKKAFPMEMAKIQSYVAGMYDQIQDRKVKNAFQEKELNFRLHQLQVQSDLTRAGHAIQRVGNDIAQGRLDVSKGQLELAKLMRPQELVGGMQRTITIAKQFLYDKEKTYANKATPKQTEELKSLRSQIADMDRAVINLDRFSKQSTTDPKAWQDAAKYVLDFSDRFNKLPNGMSLIDKTGKDLPNRNDLVSGGIDAAGRSLPFMPQNAGYRGGYERLPGTFGPMMNPYFDYGINDRMGDFDPFGQSQLPPTAGAYDPRYDDMGRTF
jgi:hypothetical protein